MSEAEIWRRWVKGQDEAEAGSQKPEMHFHAAFILCGDGKQWLDSWVHYSEGAQAVDHIWSCQILCRCSFPADSGLVWSETWKQMVFTDLSWKDKRSSSRRQFSLYPAPHPRKVGSLCENAFMKTCSKTKIQTLCFCSFQVFAQLSFMAISFPS